VLVEGKPMVITELMEKLQEYMDVAGDIPIRVDGEAQFTVTLFTDFDMGSKVVWIEQVEE